MKVFCLALLTLLLVALWTGSEGVSCEYRHRAFPHGCPNTVPGSSTNKVLGGQGGVGERFNSCFCRGFGGLRGIADAQVQGSPGLVHNEQKQAWG